MEPRQQSLSIWYVLLAFMVLLAFQSVLFGPHRENISYSGFKTLLKNGKEKVAELKSFGKGWVIVVAGCDKPPRAFTRASRPRGGRTTYLPLCPSESLRIVAAQGGHLLA